MKDTNIQAYTTFGLPAYVGAIVRFTEGDIQQLIEGIEKDSQLFVLGGGSNIILPEEMNGVTVLKIENKGIEKIEENDAYVTLKVASGEIWDDVVSYAVAHGYSGIEALSAIPGTAGATPVQNVGAYGAEIKDVLVRLDAYDRKEKKYVTIQNTECGFSYRMSKFKGEWKGRFIITHIILRLSKGKPNAPEYPGVQKYFTEKNITSPTLSQIRDAITEIRWSKLPKPTEIPNCGSFFENPIVDITIAEKIKSEYQNMPSFPVSETLVKIPAGWLIENAGLKGADFGTVGTYEKNALVLINRGNATQKDVIDARDSIIKTVHQKFGITLGSEPEIIKF